MEIDPNRILLVEDDPNDIELVHLALENTGFLSYLDVVTDGEQALRYLLGTSSIGRNPTDGAREGIQMTLPRLVILDLKLPKLSGLEVLEAIRTHTHTRQLVVVIMTSSAEDSDLEACYNLGVNSYVVKPLNFQQFLSVSRQIGMYWMSLNQTPNLLVR